MNDKTNIDNQGWPEVSLDKCSAELQQWYERSGYADPLVFLLEMISRRTATLAKSMKYEKKVAFELQLEAAKTLAPHFCHIPPKDNALE